MRSESIPLCSTTLSDDFRLTAFLRLAKYSLRCEKKASTSITSDCQVSPIARFQQVKFADEYSRAVTDEQSPIPATYSRIESRVVEALSRDDGMEYGIIFNCQMGS